MQNIDDLSKEKEALRRILIENRHNIEKQERDILNAEIFTNIIKLDSMVKAKTVMTYVSYRDEPDTYAIIDWCFANGKRICVPVCYGCGNMDAKYIVSRTDLKSGYKGIMEPKDGDAAKKEEIDIILVPGLAFDKKGYRIGYGGGYYDRYLSGYNGVSVGICYSNAISQNLPHEQFDKKVDYMVTDKGVFPAHD